jgi:hypothetical protein
MLLCSTRISNAAEPGAKYLFMIVSGSISVISIEYAEQ